MSQVSAPVSTTVIAVDIAGAVSFGAAVIDEFERVTLVARSLGFVTQDPGRPNLTVTLSPDHDSTKPIETLATAAANFDSVANPLRLRLMVHFGVVFRTETPDGTSYLGSAVRSTQSALRRAPSVGGFLATAEFATHAAKLGPLPFRLQPCTEGAALDGVSQLLFGAGPAPTAIAGLADKVDAAVVDFAKHRLAQEIGPFANALVDRTVRSASAIDQIVALLCREIDNPVARKKFADDLMRFANTRA